jgi:hypothetical protein
MSRPPTQAHAQEINKTRNESRIIATASVSVEPICVPLPEQPALLLRQTNGRKDELVALIISFSILLIDWKSSYL